MKILQNYKSEIFNHDFHKWPQGNIINTLNEFNTILQLIYTHKISRVELTQNGHYPKRAYGNSYAWTKTPTTNTFEIVLVYCGRIYKFIFWPGRFDKETTKVSGRMALNKFRKEAGNLAASFELTNNADVAEVKKQIEKPKICLAPVVKLLGDHTFEAGEDWTIFHLDIHSAYPAGIAATTPQLKDYFMKLYERKEAGDPDAKLIMNAGIGAMQSLKLSGRRYPELSRRAIEWTNKELERMTSILHLLNCSILAYNTDGIWVASRDGLPQLPDIGPALGQWDIDHVVEKIRFKSAGAYEYIENGQYKAVIRGRTRLDNIKTREDWQWGDIFHHDAVLIKYCYNPTSGLIEEVTDEKES